MTLSSVAIHQPSARTPLAAMLLIWQRRMAKFLSILPSK
jgi:hypothetical protein